MTKTLVYIPRMFTIEEFKRLVGEIPEDFEKTTSEFWEYIKRRLKTISNRIRWVSSDSFLKDREIITSCEGESTIIKDLVNNGAQIRVLEDTIVIAEIKAWHEMLEKNSSQVISELYEESLMDLSKHIVNLVKETLKDGEVGVLFFDSSFKISFPEEIRVIRMLPFNPQDYLNRHRVKKRIKQTNSYPII